MNSLPAGIQSRKVITELEPEVLREALKSLRIDEILVIETDLNREDCTVLLRTFGKHWRCRFKRDSDTIWTRSCKVDLPIPIHYWPLSHYVNMIDSNKPFVFSRYNDGEWNYMVDTILRGRKQKITPMLREDVRQTLIHRHEDPQYLMAMSPVYYLARIGLLGHVVAFLEEHNLTDTEWVEINVFNAALAAGELGPFIQALRRTNTIIVGPRYYSALTESVLPDATYFPIPSTQCYSQVDEIEAGILALVRRPAVITLSAGPAAQILIHRLYPHIGKHSTMIDMGSTWGPFVGRVEHAVHRNITKEMMERNRSVSK